MFQEVPNTDGVTCPRCGTVARAMFYDGRGEYGLQMEPAELHYECPGCGVHFDERGRVTYDPHAPQPEIDMEEIFK